MFMGKMEFGSMLNFKVFCFNFLLECLVGDLENLVGILGNSLLHFQTPSIFGAFPPINANRTPIIVVTKK